SFFSEEKSRKALCRLDPLLLVEPATWITSHSQNLRTAHVCLLFESQGKQNKTTKRFITGLFPSSRPEKLKLDDLSSL
ncbi:hypothetical protein ACQP3C_30980, partial [Escherichia coli]